jgi:predicted Zn finger-like uncharacterized protein
VNIHCPHCDASFQVPDSMVGGNVNCKSCRALIELPGAADLVLYWSIVVIVALVWFGISGAVGVFGNQVVGIIMGVIGLIVLVLSVLIS